MACFTIEFREEQAFGATFTDLVEQIDATFAEAQGIDIPVYDGPHEVIPSTAEQTLGTARKKVNRDIVVEPIPSYEVGNPFGGTTYIIGG